MSERITEAELAEILADSPSMPFTIGLLVTEVRRLRGLIEEGAFAWGGYMIGRASSGHEPDPTNDQIARLALHVEAEAIRRDRGIEIVGGDCWEVALQDLREARANTIRDEGLT